MPRFLVQYVCPVHGVVKRIDKEPKDSARYFLAYCEDFIICNVGDDQEIIPAELFVIYD